MPHSHPSRVVLVAFALACALLLAPDAAHAQGQRAIPEHGCMLPDGTITEDAARCREAREARRAAREAEREAHDRRLDAEYERRRAEAAAQPRDSIPPVRQLELLADVDGAGNGLTPEEAAEALAARQRLQAAYRDAMRRVEDAERSGDREAGLAALRDAYRARPSAELRERLSMQQSADAVGDLVQGLAESLMPDDLGSNELWSLSASEQAQVRQIHRRAEAQARTLYRQVNLTGALHHVLTGRLEDYEPRTMHPRQLEQGRVAHDVAAAIEQAGAGGTIAVMALRWEATGARSIHRIRQAAEAADRAVATNPSYDIGEAPRLTVDVTTISEMRVPEAALRQPAAAGRMIERRIVQGLTYDATRWHDAVVVASADPAWLESVRALITGSDAPRTTVRSRELDFRLSESLLASSVETATEAEALFASLGAGAVLEAAGNHIWFWGDRYLLDTGDNRRDAEYFWNFQYDLHTDRERHALQYAVESDGELYAPERGFGFVEGFRETRLSDGFEYLPHAWAGREHVLTWGLNHEAYDGRRITMCGPPNANTQRFVEYGTWRVDGDEVRLGAEQTVRLLPCRVAVLEHDDDTRGRWLLTLRYGGSPPDEVTLSRGGREVRVDHHDSFGNHGQRVEVYRSARQRFHRFRLRDVRYVWVAYDTRFEPPPRNIPLSFQARVARLLESRQRSRYREGGRLFSSLPLADVTGSARAAPLASVPGSDEKVSPFCVEAADRCGSEIFDRWIDYALAAGTRHPVFTLEEVPLDAGADTIPEPRIGTGLRNPIALNMDTFRRISAALYSRDLRDAGVSGTARVVILVGPDGQVSDAEIGESSGHEQLDQIALRAVRFLRFLPATQDGRIVRGRVRLTMPVTFR